MRNLNDNINVIALKHGQYLSQVEPFLSNGIPTNTIVHKEVPGCGITHYAITYFKDNLIGCLPNRPVIEDKVKKHNEHCKPHEVILGVHKGVSIEDIADYLSNDIVVYKKILTTPEGFIDKVIPAFGENYEVAKRQFFFLIDECERVITDVSYRGKIAAPIDQFFAFDKKALVSATVLPFSDPRFQSFKRLYVEPQYNYRKPLKLVETNNVVESLQKRLDELNSECALIFLNSTDTILAIAKRLNIVDKSHAYCSQESAYKLFINKFKNADDELDSTTLGKYNFLTSRFFSAFDITLQYQPDVIMLTDIYSAPHSVLDPHTEVIQIAGRCRNGVKSLTHISNFNPMLASQSKEEAISYLQGCFDMYERFKKLEQEINHQGAKEMVKKAREESMAHSFYTNDKLNSFMIDNYVHEERVKGYYQNFDNLQAAYALRHKHFKVQADNELYLLSDEDRLRRDAGKPAKERRKEVAKQLYSITPKEGQYPLPSLDLTNYIRSLDGKITNAYDVIGYEGLEQTDYSYSQIDKAVARQKRFNEIGSMSTQVYRSFKPNTVYTEEKVIEVLTQIRTTLNLSKRTTATMIKHFFNARRTTRNRRVVWLLSEKLDPSSIDYLID